MRTVEVGEREWGRGPDKTGTKFPSLGIMVVTHLEESKGPQADHIKGLHRHPHIWPKAEAASGLGVYLVYKERAVQAQVDGFV